MANNQTSAELEKELQNVLSVGEKEKELLEAMEKLALADNPTEQTEKDTENTNVNPKEESPVAHEEEEEEQYQTADFVDISRTSINFERNVLYPGSIDEV